jgi:hypothetical protein
MIIKQCQFSGINEYGPTVHLVHPGYNNDLRKIASVSPQLEIVQNILRNMNRNENSIYTLISALGAGEYWSSNSNADWFGEEALLHVPPGWYEMPHDRQKMVGKIWEWGYPTFYNAHSFPHHQNKDPNRAIGFVHYVMWDNQMKRVLLLVEVDRDRAR